MSKFESCVQQALDAGQLDPALAEQLRADAQVFAAQLRAKGVHSKAQAEALGAEQAAEFRKLAAKRNKYQKVLQHSANQRNEANIESHRKSPMAGLLSLLVKDLKVHKGDTAWSNIDNRATAIEGQAHSLAADMLESLHTTHLGWKQDRETLLATVREMFGESTGNGKAQKAATAFGQASEYLRERFNRAGGFIPKRDDWGMPQSHDAKKVNDAKFEAWRDFVMPRLNREAMVNLEGRIMSDDELIDGLKVAFQSIVTGGQNKRTPGAFKGKGKMANRHQDSRFLVFHNADAWIEYQEKFGSIDMYNVMTGHIRSMASEIAMMEVLGPNPHAAFSRLMDIAEPHGGNKGFVEGVWNVVNGSTDMVDLSREAVAKGTAFTRHWLMAAQLGSAALSAITDPVYSQFTRAFNGIPVVKNMKHVLAQLNPADEGDRAFAAHMGLVMDMWTSQAMSGARFAGEIDPAGKASKISETVFRASGLTAWTQAQRNAFGLDMMWHLGRQMDRPLAQVDRKFQAMMRRYGVTDDDWEIMRQASLEEHRGARYFRPQNMYDIPELSTGDADQLVTKVLEAMNTEMDFAVPTPDARVRSIMTWGGKERGTFAGEMARGTMMYKSFSMTQFLTHMNRGGIAYPVVLGISLTVGGAVALQAKEIAKGREPRDWQNWDFVIASALQGGGLGIFGDFIASAGFGQNRYGNSLWATMAGPGGAFVEDSFNLANSGFQWATDPLTGEDTNLGRQATRFAQRYIPGNSLWHSRLILERAIWDNLQEMTDDKAARNWKKYERKRETEYGQEYWWKRGESAPQF